MLRIVGGAVIGSIIKAAYFAATKQLDMAAGAGRGGRLAVPAPDPALAGPPPARDRARGRLRRGPHPHPARAHPVAAGGEGRGADIGRPAAGVAAGGTRPPRRNPRKTSSSSTRTSVMRKVIGNPGVQLFAVLLVDRAHRRAAAARHQPARRRRAGARLGRFRRAVVGVPGGLPRGRRRIDRLRPAVPGGRGRPGHDPRRPGLAGGGRAAARLRAAGRADRLPGRAAPGQGDRRAGAGGGLVRAAPGRDGLDRGRPSRHRGRVRPAPADRRSAPRGCSPAPPRRPAGPPGRSACWSRWRPPSRRWPGSSAWCSRSACSPPGAGCSWPTR